MPEGLPAIGKAEGRKAPYCAAEKRLSNELAGAVGWAPATTAPCAAGAVAGVSVTDGFRGGRAAA